MRAPERVLELRLEVELGVEVAVDELVERALAGGVGAGRPGGEPLDEGVGLGHHAVVGIHPVDQAPVERLRRRDALAQHRHLERPRPTHGGGNQGGRPAVRHQADVDEGEPEEGGLGSHDQIASQRQRAADAHCRPVDRRDHRLLESPHAGDARVVHIAELGPDVGHAVVGGLEAGLQVGPMRIRARRR